MSEVAGDEMREALAKLTPARGIVLDLRGNPGGLVTNAVDICSMFLDGGVVVSTVDKTGKTVDARATGMPISKQPLVVLIDQGSASAAEITSGALHDNDRAPLVGVKSFGKGLVQAINRLDDGSGVNITIARYVTPDNIDIHKKGITPDYNVELKAEDYKAARGPWWLDPGGPTVKREPSDLKDIQLKKAVDVLEQKVQRVASPYQIKLNFPSFGMGPFEMQMH
jgi:carboxyl-terminal processing protease